MPIAKEYDDDKPRQEPIPAGNELAVCYSVIDLGHQYNEAYDKSPRKILIQWEVPEYRIEIEKDDKKLDLPRAISETYTNSLHEKANLRKALEAWRGKEFTAEELAGFEVGNVAGHACMLQIIHEASKKDPTKIFAKVSTVSSVPRRMEKPKAENPVVVWDLPPEGEPIVIPETFPQWVKDTIMRSQEWKKMKELEAAREGHKSQPTAFDADAVSGADLAPVDDPDADDLPF